MVKIRLRRIGTKGHPFYRVVVAPSAAARNGHFVENIGTYDPVAQPARVQIDEERAIFWLRSGARPTETAAYLLNKLGILPKYFEERPAAKEKYKFLDKTTGAISRAKRANVAASPVAEAPVAVEPKAEQLAEVEPEVEATVAETETPEATDAVENPELVETVPTDPDEQV